MPIREYVYDAADEDARRRTVSDAQSQGSNSVYAHSDGSSLHFVEAGNKTGSADVYDKLVERCNAELSKAVLGRTSSAISASTPKADLFRKALDMGLPIDDDYIYEQLGIEKPADYAAIKKDLDEKDVLPNLRWVPSTAAEPNAEHRAYWNTVLPVNHPFWSQHKPGDRWGCQCSLEATDDPVTKSPTSIDHADPGLDNNPGKDGRLFSESHPYFPDSCQDCPFNKSVQSGLFSNKAKDCYNCNYIPYFDKLSLKEKLDSLANASSSEYGRILESIIRSREFKPVEGYPNVFAMPSDERTSLLPIADKAVKHGNTVYIMANPKDSKSMDFVFKKNGNIKGYEKKNASGKNSIGNRLEDSSSQARRALISIETNYNPRLLINEIKRHFEYDDNCLEVLIYKGGKEISIEREYFYDKNYIKNFLRIWAK